MTDQEICVAAMTNWPEEARPSKLRRWTVTGVPHFYAESFMGNHERILDDHAAALFRDSGLAWLLWLDGDAPRACTSIAQLADRFMVDSDRVPLSVRLRTAQEGPTLLSAIDSAIRSLSK